MSGSPSRRRGRMVAGARARQMPVGAHEGTYRDFLRRHERAADAVAQAPRAQRAEFARGLTERAADSRNLMCAIDTIVSQGPRALGTDQIQLCDLDNRERWQFARELSRVLRDGSYRPGPVRRIDVPKASGQGTRPIEIPTVDSKVAQRATLQIVKPFLEPALDHTLLSNGLGRNREHALAAVESTTHATQRSTWICQDLRDAYTTVPCQRLYDVLRRHGLPEELVALIRQIVGPQRRHGIPQGGPLSSLLLDTYLDHFLDGSWLRRHPDTPLTRVADDLLVICRTEEEARLAHVDLDELVRVAGMQLKHEQQGAIRRLDQGDEADWLGFKVGLGHNGLEVRISERSHRSLSRHLEECHAEPMPSLRARESVLGWIQQLGPCRRQEQVEEVYARVAALAGELAFEELPDIGRFEQDWDRAYVRYRCVRRVVSHTLAGGDANGSARPHRCSADRGRGSGSPSVGDSLPPFTSAPLIMLTTVGACDGPHGVGGWAFELVRLGSRTSRSGSYPLATNNRMQLMAVIHGLEAIEIPSRVRIVTDSRYVHQGIVQHLPVWRSQGWRRQSGGSLRNAALWQRLADLLDQHQVECQWLRGHRGQSDHGPCDQMARDAMRSLGTT